MNRLTERELHNIVNESLNRMLMERKAWVNPYSQYMQNYGDNGFGTFYNPDNSQRWKTDVYRLNSMLKDMQNYCPKAASSIRRAISQIYNTIGTEGLEKYQQHQGWQQTSTQPDVSVDYTQNQTQPNVNVRYTQNSTMPQYQQQPQAQPQPKPKPVRKGRKRKMPQQPVQQQMPQNPYANARGMSTFNYNPYQN